MSLELRQRIFDQLDALVLVDPHTHINALNPASQTLADILGYHYYTELAHSAGMPREQIEEPGISPKEKVGRLIARMGPIDNTIQYSWLVEMCQKLFGFRDTTINVDNWEALYDTAESRMSAPDWAHQVMAASKLEALFLTNDFDDPLEGFDTRIFIPCLRTDDLVFHLAKPSVQQRLGECTGVDVTNAATLRAAIGGLFHYFKSRNARACAISLPPDFSPTPVTDARADTAIAELYRKGTDASDAQRKAAANFVFWTLAQYCAIYQLPFDLMIGVNRSVYPAGVYQGMDLYDSRVSLIQYKQLFNAFPQVTFPISVLASVTNQELASYAWIFPNVVTNGHWWYSNTPTFIEHDCAARLEAVPRTKQIGYYSDMYKLEFALPKFAMYKRILAKVLAERYVIDRGWKEDQAIALGQQILRGNVDTIFAETPMPEFAPPPAEEESPAPEIFDAGAAAAVAMPMAAAAMLDDVATPGEEVSEATLFAEPAPLSDEPLDLGDEPMALDATPMAIPATDAPMPLDEPTSVAEPVAPDEPQALPVAADSDDSIDDLLEPVSAMADPVDEIASLDDEGELVLDVEDAEQPAAPAAPPGIEEESLDLGDLLFEPEPDDAKRE